MGTEFWERQGVGKRTGSRPQEPLGHTPQIHSQRGNQGTGYPSGDEEGEGPHARHALPCPAQQLRTASIPRASPLSCRVHWPPRPANKALFSPSRLESFPDPG